MFTFASPPPPAGGNDNNTTAAAAAAANASSNFAAPPWTYKPAISSPLAKSSPPRPTSPLSPLASSFGNRQPPQSSPVRGPFHHHHHHSSFSNSNGNPPVSRFASRPAKPLPFARDRQEAQDGRRWQYFEGARQRAQDRSWQRRDIEGFAFRQTLQQENSRYRAEASIMAPTDQDIEDAAAFAASAQQPLAEEWDEMMADDVAWYEEMELNARLADMEAAAAAAQQQQQQQQQQQRQQHQTQLAVMMGDDFDDDFDQVLMGLADAPRQSGGASDGMDMS